MFSKILIANRGEIACRVIRTARRMGIGTVAVYSDADAKAMHVAMADQSVRIGSAAAKESYLLGERIIAAAQTRGAQAIHPGYGFLSENADFALACEQAGVVFIGPPASAIRAMGSKSAAKALMDTAGVPLVPGYHGDDQDPALLQREADRIGYPLLIKASAGGGGKGMRTVNASVEFHPALASCMREAANAFGDDKVLLERYVTRPRHIEIQVFADTHGNAVYLFERDCSVQRRHQKVLEEAPAPGMTAARRAQMGAAAVAAATAIGYVGAGTVEFIADQSGTFHFMEMNTRLQVEHPVTEMITGEDLVEWQLRVAFGERLPKLQSELAITGHALEARIYAEDPDRGFLPATGRIAQLALPATNPQVRVDTGVRSGDEISPFYDPMIAKLIVWGEDRAAACARMRAALADFHVVGLTTNIAFLERTVASRAFASADLDTALIERSRAELFPAATAASDALLAIAAAVALNRSTPFSAPADPHSPWAANDGWCLNGAPTRAVTLADGTQHERVEFGRGTIHLRGRTQPFQAIGKDDRWQVWLGAESHTARVFIDADMLHISTRGERRIILVVDPLAQTFATDDRHGGGLTAPMPGKIIALLVKAGQAVERGAPLIVMEAMKMEHTIVATSAGTVDELLFAVGEQVTDGAPLVTFKAT